MSNYLKDMIKLAKKEAESQSTMHHIHKNDKRYEGFLDSNLGVTQGQVLHKDQDGKLEMLRCWLVVKIVRDYLDDTNPYKIAFRPLLPDCLHDYYLDTKVMSDLTGFHHHFGGDIVWFEHDAFPRFKQDEPIEPQLDGYAIKTVPAQRHHVYEGNDGSLIIGYRALFELGKECQSFINQYDCYINRYQQLPWFEPDGKPDSEDDNEYSEQEALHASIADTGDKTIIAPTIWLKENDTHECFLSFLTNWRQSKRGDRVTSKIGKFIITHELTRGNKLMTQTSLRVSDSIWMSPEYC